MKNKVVFAMIIIISIVFMACNNTSNNDNVKNQHEENNEYNNGGKYNTYEANDETTLEIGLKEKFIINMVNDISTDKELVMEGDFTKTDTTDSVKVSSTERKLELHKYTLETPKFTVKSKDTIIENGIIKGDIYVSSNNFTISNVKVEGNVYFMEQEFKDTFNSISNSIIEGKMEIK